MAFDKYRKAAIKFFKNRAKKSEVAGNDDEEMSFLDHLEELRGTILKCLFALVIAFLISIIGFSYVNKALMYPLNSAKQLLVKYNSLTGEDLDSKIPARAEKIGPFFLVEESADDSDVEKKGPYYMVSENGAKTKGATTLTLLKSGSTGEAAMATGNWYANIQLRAMSFQTPIIIWFSVGLLGGFAIALPFMLYFIAQFVSPGLLPAEKRLLKPVLLASLVLFFIGVSFAFFIMLPFGIAFLSNMSHDFGIEMFPDAQSYYMMVIFLTFAVGITFELPLLEVALLYLGVLNPEVLRRNRRMVFLIILIFAAIITPPDCITQILLTVPLYLFYEIALKIGSSLHAKKLAREAEEEKKAEIEDQNERAKYVKEEAERRKKDGEDSYIESSKEKYPKGEVLDENYDYDNDYGEKDYYDFNEEDYIDYEEEARLNKLFSPDWSLNEPDLSFFAPHFEEPSSESSDKENENNHSETPNDDTQAAEDKKNDAINSEEKSSPAANAVENTPISPNDGKSDVNVNDCKDKNL